MAQIVGGNSKYLEEQHLSFKKSSKDYNIATISFGLLSLVIISSYFIFRINELVLLLIIPTIVYFVVIRRSEKDEKTSGQYRQGQIGEWEVKTELSKLPENYTIFCDLKFSNKKWNTDFLVSGPTGIFAIEVKSYKGNIVVKNIYESIIRQVVNEALQIRDYLWQRTGKDIFVTAVLVYSSDQANVRTTLAQSNVTVTHKNSINQFILSQKDISKEHNVLDYQNHLTLLTAHNSFK